MRRIASVIVSFQKFNSKQSCLHIAPLLYSRPTITKPYLSTKIVTFRHYNTERPSSSGVFSNLTRKLSRTFDTFLTRKTLSKKDVTEAMENVFFLYLL